MNENKILVIKHGSLGDIISATGVLNCIRRYYKDSEIHLLTTSQYEKILKRTNFFDLVFIDNRNKFFSNISNVYNLLSQKYNLVIDLQNSQRTMFYALFFNIFTSTKWNGTRLGSNIRYKYNI